MSRHGKAIAGVIGALAILFPVTAGFAGIAGSPPPAYILFAEDPFQPGPKPGASAPHYLEIALPPELLHAPGAVALAIESYDAALENLRAAIAADPRLAAELERAGVDPADLFAVSSSSGQKALLASL